MQLCIMHMVSRVTTKLDAASVGVSIRKLAG
ncbi:hypothetical protein THICB2_760055 [Thiomonas sp. CB2]|nr:hypothetical protein THICB2_760055 [Thiomonas sp. CB2]